MEQLKLYRKDIGFDENSSYGMIVRGRFTPANPRDLEQLSQGRDKTDFLMAVDGMYQMAEAQWRNKDIGDNILPVWNLAHLCSEILEEIGSQLRVYDKKILYFGQPLGMYTYEGEKDLIGTEQKPISTGFTIVNVATLRGLSEEIGVRSYKAELGKIVAYSKAFLGEEQTIYTVDAIATNADERTAIGNMRDFAQRILNEFNRDAKADKAASKRVVKAMKQREEELGTPVRPNKKSKKANKHGVDAWGRKR